jgi:sulfoxide reductase heme-binding subunit YedZ
MAGHKFDPIRMLLKPSVFLLSLLPVAYLVWEFFSGGLSANPISDITKETGTWTLRFLVATIAITPLKELTGWSRAQQLRRMIGLFAFFYATLHFTTYVYLDKFFEWDEIVKDVAKRPFITVGFSVLIMLATLAVTSPNAVVKWMGGKRWRLIHRLVYLCAVGGVIHYYWLVKADTRRPLIYGTIVTLLLGYRVLKMLPNRRMAKSKVDPTLS